MLATLVRKEILSHILSFRFALTFVLFLGLLFISMYVTVDEHQRQLRWQGSRTRLYDAKLAEIMALDTDWGTNGRLERLFRSEGYNQSIPISSMGWLCQGLDPHLPAGINIRYGDQAAIARQEVRNPLMGLLSLPDFTYIVNIILSLLAILFMFDAISGEKEAGTLRLMLSNAVPRSEILLGKWIGGYVVLLIPFLIAACGGVLYAWHRGVFTAGGELMTRMVMILVLAAIYIAVFFNLSLFISTLTHRSTTSLLLCLLVWVVFILAIPNVAPVVAKLLEPTPPLQKIGAEKRAVDREIDLKVRNLESVSGQLGYGGTVEDERNALESERQMRKRQLDQYYENARASQFTLAGVLGRLSPSAAWVYAAVAMADSGPAYYHRIERAGESLGSQYRQMIEEKFGRLRRGGGDDIELRDADIPRLSVTASSLQQSMEASLNDILLLFVFNVLFFMLAFVFFLRYDVR